MKFTIKNQDLFTVSKDYYLCHCISADFALGAGIAKKFAEMGVKKELVREYSGILPYSPGYCLYTAVTNWQGEYNLVTKDKHYQKPTLESVRRAIESMKQVVYDGEKIAMPKIGCGLDRLNWEDVESIIKEVFADTDAEILVCDWKEV